MVENKPIIELVQLSKQFVTKTATVRALDNINLKIYPGEIFGIIGASGAGKSTLVRCINLLEKPTAGQVIFDGQELTQLKNRELRLARQSMGMIFQQFNLLMQRTVLKNVCFPLEIAQRENAEGSELSKIDTVKRAKELLEIVGLSDKANNYPSQLSGGQKQRVAIARALATNPKVLLCDEATSALDPNTTRSILALLKDINARLGITIVVITHEMSVIEEICNRVAIISDSQIAEIGNVNEIFSSPKTEAGRKLVFPDGHGIEHFTGQRCMRIVFDGNSSFEPVIANMVLDCKQPVNIIFADSRNIDGKAYGQIVIQLPEDERMAERMIHYLKARNLTIEEVPDYV